MKFLFCGPALALALSLLSCSGIVGSGSGDACEGKGPAMIGASPIDVDEIAYIVPMGQMIGDHVTPIDHGYFYIKAAWERPPRQAAVKSPLEGVITSVERSTRREANGRSYDDYALTIEATCTFRVRLSNLVGLAGGLEQKVGPLGPDKRAEPDYRVLEGELIGYAGLPTALGIDVWIINDDSTLTGFVNLKHDYEEWKLHVVDLFDYTKEPLKSQLLELNLRQAPPRWGKIDYDIDGRLVGNWYREGSGGYRGGVVGPGSYWVGHLSVVYDAYDPSQIVFSIGNYEGQPRQFAVIGNAPDPAQVSQATGPVKYELAAIINYRGDTGALWNHRSYVPNLRTRAGDAVQATVLMQLTGPRQLKLEVFPGRTAAEVTSFGPGALLYER